MLLGYTCFHLVEAFMDLVASVGARVRCGGERL